MAAWGGAVRCRKILAFQAFQALPARHTAPLRLRLLCPVLQSAIEKPLPSRLSTSWLPHTRTAQSEAPCRQESRQASLASVGCTALALALGSAASPSVIHDDTARRLPSPAVDADPQQQYNPTPYFHGYYYSTAIHRMYLLYLMYLM